MKNEVVDILLALNQVFYNQFAAAFNDSRSPSEPGFERLLTLIQPGDRVLDLGCGQARLARLLPPTCRYTGVDYAEEMLALAGTPSGAEDGLTVDTTMVPADLVRDDWSSRIRGPFDWVVLRAVLHHIPGYANRLRVLTRAATVLAPANGRVAIANWQFLRIDRLRRRVLPWSTLTLGDSDVEPGDYLLDWQRQGRGMRYAHLIDKSETQRLAHDAGLEIEDLFYADGHTNDLTLYAVLSKESTPVL